MAAAPAMASRSAKWPPTLSARSPAGIYFAVQANYEQQFVSANQQALNAGVREYKAAFAKALKTLPALLRTTSATPNLIGPRPGHRGGHHGAVKPSPSRS